MITGKQYGHHAAKLLIFTLGIGLLSYFAYHALQGDTGYLRYLTLQEQVSARQAVLNTVSSDRKHIEDRVVLLRPDNLDLDMLDERARLVLNYSKSFDLVIPLVPEAGRSFPMSPSRDGD